MKKMVKVKVEKEVEVCERCNVPQSVDAVATTLTCGDETIAFKTLCVSCLGVVANSFNKRPRKAPAMPSEVPAPA